MSFWDEVKKFAQPYGADDDYDDFDEELDDGFAEEDSAPRFAHKEAATSAPAAEQPTFVSSAPSGSTAPSVGFSGTVINTGSSSKQQLVLVRPESFNDAPAIAGNLRSKKAIVLNLENVDKALARRVVDFLSGCAYSLDGSVKKVSQSTYLFCPYNMEVLGDLTNLQSEVENYV